MISLRRVLTEIKDHPELLTREWHASIYEHSPVSPDQSWEQYAGDVGDHVDPALVQNDLDALLEAATKARRWTSKHVAHAVRKRRDVTLTFAELDQGIDAINFFMTRYDLLLTGAHWAELSDLQGLRTDLAAVLSEPWFRA